MDENTDRIFNNDVLFMKNLLGKSVEIETIDNKIHKGAVYVIDPTHKTTILMVASNAETKESHLEFIPYDAVKRFIEVAGIAYEFPAPPTKSEYCQNEMAQNKKTLEKWLRHMFINVRDEGECLKVEDHIEIGPPYDRNSCNCENVIVLERIRGIIDSMPDGF